MKILSTKRFRFYIVLILDLFLLRRQIRKKKLKARILLSISSPGSVGGTEFQVNKFAESLINAGFPPLVLITGPINNKKNHLFLDRLRKHGIPFVFLGNVGFSNFPFIQNYLRRMIKSFEATHFQCFNPKSACLIPAAKNAGLKILYTETGLPIKNSWWASLTSYISSIDMTLAVSQASLSAMRHLFNYQGPGAVIYSLIDPPPQNLERNRPDENALQIVFFGRMDRLKGVDLLLEAFRELLLSYPEARLTYIGEGDARPALQQKVVQWNLSEHVNFVDFQEKEPLYEMLVNFDLFCLPSFTEGAPCTILEAMSVGLPIIATRVGGIPEMIEEGISGLLIPAKDPKALLHSLKYAAMHPEFRKALGKNGLKRYKEVLAKNTNYFHLLRRI